MVNFSGLNPSFSGDSFSENLSDFPATMVEKKSMPEKTRKSGIKVLAMVKNLTKWL